MRPRGAPVRDPGIAPAEQRLGVNRIELDGLIVVGDGVIKVAFAAEGEPAIERGPASSVCFPTT